MKRNIDLTKNHDFNNDFHDIHILILDSLNVNKRIPWSFNPYLKEIRCEDDFSFNHMFNTGYIKNLRDRKRYQAAENSLICDRCGKRLNPITQIIASSPRLCPHCGVQLEKDLNQTALSKVRDYSMYFGGQRQENYWTLYLNKEENVRQNEQSGRRNRWVTYW